MVSARLSDGEVFDSAKLKNTVRFLIENDMRNVVIDLGNLEYLYSDTINAFIASNRHMLEVSGRIAILTEHPKVQDILKRAGLDNIMRIYRSEAEMIADSKEILRQTSSYRIEELQKISTIPAEIPSTPKTEFDDFKAEMGHRLGSKLDNNELPQYQVGVPQANAPTAPVNFNAPTQGNPAYPSFGAPSFQAPEALAPMFPQNPAQQGFNYNNPGFGVPGAAQPFPSPTPPPSQTHASGNFDYPTVQLPVGQFGNPPQPPSGISQGGPSQGYPSNSDRDEDDDSDPRGRKPSQERMRSPNARRQQGRRVGGRETNGPDDEIQDSLPYQELPAQEAFREPERYIPPASGMPNTLVTESRFPIKLVVGLLLLIIAGSIYYVLNKKAGTEAAVNPPPAVSAPTPPTVPTPATPPNAAVPVTPAIPATPASPTVTPSASTPVNPAPAAPVNAPASVKAPVAETPKPAPKPPKPEPTPKQQRIVQHKKTPKVERTERAPSVPAANPEPAASAKGLHITSTPSGAEVLVNFSKKGSTPLDISLGNNSNKIIVRMAGYKRYENTLPKNYPEHDLDVTLEKEGGSDEMESVAPSIPKPEPVPTPPPPPPAPKPVVKAQPKPEPKPEPEVQEPQDLPMAKQAPKESEAPTPSPRPSADAAPTPGDGPIGIIFLSSSPARADIIIDGKNTGKKTPAKVELPSGSHRFEMTKSGQHGQVDQMVNEGKNKAVHLNLQ